MTDTTSTSTPSAPDTGAHTTYNVIAVAFDADVNAYAALTKLKELDAQDQIEVHEAVVAQRATDGTVTVKDQVGSPELLGTAGGGLTGLLVGILGGPVGVLIGGSTGLLVGSLLDLAMEFDILQKRGSWISYKGTQLAQGRDACKEALKADETLYAEVEVQVKEKLAERGGVIGKRGAGAAAPAAEKE